MGLADAKMNHLYDNAEINWKSSQPKPPSIYRRHCGRVDPASSSVYKYMAHEGRRYKFMRGRTKILITAKVTKQRDGWIIIGLPCGDCGPYPDQETATDDALGLERTYKYHNQKGFITSEQS